MRITAGTLRRAMGPYVVGLLNQLGYHAVLRQETSRYFKEAYPPGPGVQVAIDGWIADYASAANFMSLFECGASQGLSRLCEPRVDAAIKRATAAQISRPEQASELWAEVDHLVVDLGAQVDFINAAAVDFLSERAGNYQHSPQWGLLIDQLWVI